MQSVSLSLFVLAALATNPSTPIATPIATSTPTRSDDVVAGVVLVAPEASFKDDVDAAAIVAGIATAARVPLVFVRRTALDGWIVVRTPVDAAVAAHVLSSTKGVRAAQVDVRRHALAAPNDPRYPDLWAFDAIEMESAWDSTTGVGSQRIGLVDTGIRRNHVDLAPKDVTGFDFVSDPVNAGDGDGRDDDYSDEGGDDDFHGSHVAGTMLARGNDGKGVPGVNWNAGLVTARALGTDGGGDLVDIIEGALWLAGFDVDGVPSLDASDRATVINMSLGGSSACSAFEHDAMTKIVGAKVVVVAAAGNDGGPTGSPANCPGVIAVAATDSSLALAEYSSFDARIDVVAPGGDPDYRTNPAGGILSVNGATRTGYKSLSGTSMAAPHVAGVVSLMQAVNPSLTPAKIKTILKGSPYTCDGCADKAFLQADDAVNAALAARSSSGHGGSHGTHTHDGVDGNDGVCDAARGNWDCSNGQGCVGGVCVDGEAGRTAFGDACQSDDACASGLCDRGVCTRPCDDDACPGSMTCDAAVIPGGLCRVEPPLSCASSASATDAASLLPVVGYALFRMRRRRGDTTNG